MRRLLVNDMLSALPDHRTFWHDLMDWFGMEFVGGDYSTLAEEATTRAVFNDASGTWSPPSLIIRNATYFGPIKTSTTVPTICLLQDVLPDGPARDLQVSVMASSRRVVFNSRFTASRYTGLGGVQADVIPLPVDFSIFEPGNAMGLQQALSLPAGCVCWVGACTGAAGEIKGYDLFRAIVRANPDVPFVAVFKDAAPDPIPPNLRVYVQLSQPDLAQVMGACAVGLCTSRQESQHLAGIEMGACGLPLVVPGVGTYWERKDWPGIEVLEPQVASYTNALRGFRTSPHDPQAIRAYWMKEFHPEVVRLLWTALVRSVENGA